MSLLRLATRGSLLARTQSGSVAAALEAATGRSSELVIVRTTGDRVQDVALGDVGSIGLFTSEVQQAVLDGRADYAVHSLKDLPAEQAEGLVRAAVPARADSADLLLARPEAADPAAAGLPLRRGARVGTASARRQAFLAALRPDLRVELLRGNVPTRVEKLRGGAHDAILLAAAGIHRLGLDLAGLEQTRLDPGTWPGAPGQGALAIECRAGDDATRDLLAALHDAATDRAVAAERGLLRALGGGCGLPLGAFASLQGEDSRLRLVAALGPTEGRPGAPPLARAEVEGEDPAALAAAARAALLAADAEPEQA